MGKVFVYAGAEKVTSKKGNIGYVLYLLEKIEDGVGHKTVKVRTPYGWKEPYVSRETYGEKFANVRLGVPVEIETEFGSDRIKNVTIVANP